MLVRDWVLKHPNQKGMSHECLLETTKQLSQCWASGAHNTIVTSRAGKDLVSCLVAGLLTIGPRFGGAIDDAARYFQVRLGLINRWPQSRYSTAAAQVQRRGAHSAHADVICV